MDDIRILFIINLKSGSSDNETVEQTLHHVVAGFIDTGNKISYEVIELTDEITSEFIKERINTFKPNTIAAGGGDGTINFVASIIAGMDVRLGIIPLGSANGLASELGIPTKIDEAVKLVITGKSLPMDIVRINDDHISLHLSDLGINARIIKEFEKEGKRGLSAYFKQFLKELVKPQKSFKCTVSLNGESISHHAYMTLIANSNKYGTGANINPSGQKDDGVFEVILIRPYRRWIWRSFIGAFTGTFHKKPHVEVYPCEEATITVTPAQELQIDGENLGKHNKVHAKIEKHALKVVMI